MRIFQFRNYFGKGFLSFFLSWKTELLSLQSLKQNLWKSLDLSWKLSQDSFFMDNLWIKSLRLHPPPPPNVTVVLWVSSQDLLNHSETLPDNDDKAKKPCVEKITEHVSLTLVLAHYEFCCCGNNFESRIIKNHC